MAETIEYQGGTYKYSHGVTDGDERSITFIRVPTEPGVLRGFKVVRIKDGRVLSAWMGNVSGLHSAVEYVPNEWVTAPEDSRGLSVYKAREKAEKWKRDWGDKRFHSVDISNWHVVPCVYGFKERGDDDAQDWASRVKLLENPAKASEPEPVDVDEAQFKALLLTIEKWKLKAAGKAEYTGDWDDCPMCCVNTPKGETPGWMKTNCQSCLLYQQIEPEGQMCVKHHGLDGLRERYDQAQGAAEFLAALVELRDKLRPEKPDGAEALGDKIFDVYYGATGSHNTHKDGCIAVSRYIEANFTPKAELLSEFQGEWQKGWNAGFEANRQARDVRCKACEKGAAGKPTISPENLDVLVRQQYWIHCRVPPMDYDQLWGKLPPAGQEAFRNRVLSMLNAEVADPDEAARKYGIECGHKVDTWKTLDEIGKDYWRKAVVVHVAAERDLAPVAAPAVDFVVSGEDGFNMVAMSSRAKSRVGRVHDGYLTDTWRRLNCQSRRSDLAAFYEDGFTILLDKNGGAE